jgi:hypothetical protein
LIPNGISTKQSGFVGVVGMDAPGFLFPVSGSVTRAHPRRNDRLGPRTVVRPAEIGETL